MQNSKVLSRIPTWDKEHFDNTALQRALSSKYATRIPFPKLLLNWLRLPVPKSLEQFAWRTDPFGLTPTLPAVRSQMGANEPVYTTTNESHDVPTVEEARIDPARADLTYEFLLFAYQSVPRTGNWETDIDDFVCLSNEGLGFDCPDKFFIRLQDLRDRLSGTVEQRSEAYAADWFVALVGMNSLDRSLVLTELTLESLLLPDLTSISVPGDLPASLVAINIVMETLVKMPPNKPNSHFPMWNLDGSPLDWSAGAKFLASLFQPVVNGKSQAKDLIGRYTFNLCRLARAAAVLEKQESSLDARFWNRTVEGSANIQLLYYLSPSWSHNNKKQWTLQPAARTLWKNIIDVSHTTAISSLSKVPGDQLFIPSPTPLYELDNAPSQDDYVWIGSHPQRFYDLYVSKRDWWRMHQAGFQLGSWSPPTADKIDALKQAVPDQDPDIEDTYTEISFEKSELMKQDLYNKPTSQNALMQNKESEEVGKSLSNVTGVRRAEWLHRSSWSFGGMNNDLERKDDDPFSSQQRANIVWATYEAHTRIMRYEEFLKRVVRLYEEKVMRLWTRRVHGDWVYVDPSSRTDPIEYSWPYKHKYEDRNSAWILSSLVYEWELFSDPEVPEQLCHGSAEFYLFSRSGCTRFELKMDECVDNELARMLKLEDDPYNPAARQIRDHLWHPDHRPFFGEF